MSLIDCGYLFWPPPQVASDVVTMTTNATSVTIDATNDRLAFVSMAAGTFNIKTIRFRVGAVTTGNTAKMSIQTVGADGKPSGTLWSANGTGASPSGTVAVAGSNTWQTVTLTNQAELVAGDLFAIVFEHDSGSTPSYLMQNATMNAGCHLATARFPLIWTDIAGTATWTSSSTANTPWLWVCESSTANDVIVIPGLSPLDGNAAASAITDTAERALKFVAPFTGRVIGARIVTTNPAAALAWSFSLWDSTDDPGSGPTPLAQITMDSDLYTNTSGDGNITVFFTSPYTVTAGTTYYLGVLGTGANGNLYELPCGGVTNAIRCLGAGVGNTAHLSTRTWGSSQPAPPTGDPGAWSDTTTTMPCISLIFDQIDDGASGGGRSAIQALSIPGVAIF
jgi:hypothetical protein